MITAKEHFASLRAEDQKAVVLLARDLGDRLDKMATAFEDLKTSVDRFHAAYTGHEDKGQNDKLLTFNTISILIAIALLVVEIYRQH